MFIRTRDVVVIKNVAARLSGEVFNQGGHQP